MGKCANDLMYNIPIWTLQTKASIRTFAHSPIRTFPKHSHIHTFAHFFPHDLRITTYRWQCPRWLNHD
jgi:hypothetical protein